MAEFLRRIPLMGRVIELLAGDSLKRKLKNKLRRLCASASIASALLHSVPTLSVPLAGYRIPRGNSWHQIDAYIDSLEDESVLIISMEINWVVLPLILGIGISQQKRPNSYDEQQSNTDILFLFKPTDILFPFCPLGFWQQLAQKKFKKQFKQS